MNTCQRNVIIVAGGKGLRAGGEIPKQFQCIAERPMLMRSIDVFHQFDPAMQIVLVLHPDYIDLWEKLCETHRFTVPCRIALGGTTRFESVKNGLALLSDCGVTGVHDAARPFVAEEVIANCYATAFERQCGVIPVVDEPNSVRYVEADKSRILDRSRVKIVQTPQVFPTEILKNAYTQNDSPDFTDDASVVEKAGTPIALVSGNVENIKITTPFDFIVAEALLQEMYF